MLTNQPIEIKFSKTKNFILLLISLGFVTLGIWLIISPLQMRNKYLDDITKITIAGYACAIFFGCSTFIILRKFLDNSPQLIIDNIGLINNTKNATANHILWADVEKARIITYRTQSFMIIHVKNPEEYIINQPGFLKRKTMQLNYKMFGSPIIISVTGLNISLNKLWRIINEKSKKQTGNNKGV